MELDQLRYFVKIANEKSFTRASEELLVSQPALSRSVTKLETELGQPVFERQSRTLALTDAGKKLLERATQILKMVEDAKAEIDDDGKQGTVRIGAIPTVAPYLLPSLLREFSLACPNARIEVREDVTERLMQACNYGEVDIVLAASPLTLGYLESESVLTEELKLVIPYQHPLAQKKRIDIDDLVDVNLIMLGEGHCLSDQITAFCRQGSVQPLALDRTSQLTTILELVSLGLGLSFIPEMACQNDRNRRRIFRSLAKPSPTRQIVCVRNPYRFESKLVKCFRRVITNLPRTQ